MITQNDNVNQKQSEIYIRNQNKIRDNEQIIITNLKRI